MRSEAILDAIGEADDRYIEEAAPRGKKAQKYAWMKWGAAAACLALAVYAGLRFLPPESSGPNVPGGTGSLPMLTIPSETGGGMGFEACMAHEISELDNGNPWSADTQLKTLPVYRNSTAYDSAGAAGPGIGKERMLESAERAAKALKMKITGVAYGSAGNPSKGGGADEAVSSLTATTDAAEIEVTGNDMVTVSFRESIELPREYGFTYANPSDEEAGKAADYLMERFSEFLSFRKPRKALFADYTSDGNRNRSYYAYDADGDLTERILNFNFNKVQFAPDDSGNLMLIRKSDGLSCAEKIGDYPLVTSEEALKLLLDGNYITSVPEKMPGEEYVAKTELVYQTGYTNATFLPYYRFWVELPDMRQENGLKTFGAYYVPAVQQRYISNLPLWDGGFN